ncbi:unnamed protein product [Sphenostylis stenocarpa]|uniref:WRKY domain-containing protein n=1 Tax=Sphenostylis stenocarpa TaxID=92480 RepID=A0AA86VZW7_9FABA|nr:unnamed protein product [Sphenostylis stenocarpa]
MNYNMLCSESGSLSARKKREIIKKIVKGQKAATQLKILLQNPFGTAPSPSSHQLMTNVLTSFTQALSIIQSSSSQPGSANGVARRDLLTSGAYGSPLTGSSHDPMSGHCREKRSQNGRRELGYREGGFDELGCVRKYGRSVSLVYISEKRFSRKGAVTWTILSSTTDDDHAWRKYGQKGILNSEFPRSYFRCSYKYDQRCQAVKQVQVDEDNPRMYRTKYIGIHTCNPTPNTATHPTTWESYFLNSDHDSDPRGPLITSPTLFIKQDFSKETHTSSDLTDHKLLDPIMLSDLKDFELSNPTVVPLGKEFGNSTADNVYSCTDSQNLDMDFGGVAPDDFGTHFHFDKGVTTGAVTSMIKTKQVQLDKENPNMYETTFVGHHTCNATTMSTHSEIDYSSTAWESYLLKFGLPNVQDHHISSPNLTIKEELPKEDTPSDVTSHNLDPNIWIDYGARRDGI